MRIIITIPSEIEAAVPTLASEQLSATVLQAANDALKARVAQIARQQALAAFDALPSITVELEEE